MSLNSSENSQGKKIYLKTLAREHNLHFETYISKMEHYNDFLIANYDITISKLKGKALLPWQVELLRRLNPTDFEISTMKDYDEFRSWQNWISGVVKDCKKKKNDE